MDINNNQQINTFTKGMDTDTSDMYIGEGSYRYAENLRVVTDKDGNTGELHLIEGTNIVSEVHGPGVQLLGFTSIRNYIVEIVKRGSAWAICRRTVEKDEQTGEYKVGEREVVAGQFTKPIWPENWDGKTKPLSLVTRWEADDNIKLYIANGYTEILSINIAELNQGNIFDKVFEYAKISLSPIQASVTQEAGAKIPGVVLQYAYITYKVNGASSTLSTLSNVVSQTVDKTHGYKVDENSKRTVALTLPNEMLGRLIRIYRVAYSRAGQLPRVDVIYDQKCDSTDIKDIGQSLENISSAEFIAANKLSFIASEIESKSDYLFAGNIEYVQDKIDKQFENFDARCYSKGVYYKENGDHFVLDTSLSTSAQDQKFIQLKNTSIYNKQFDSGQYSYDPQWWKSATYDTGEAVNGHGLCFDWKYVYDESDLYYIKQYDGNPTPRTYARNEVYRFGVRLFDEKGNASSVKWIADIKMPDYSADGVDDSTIKSYVKNIEGESDHIKVNNLSIKFIPRNTNSDYWKNVSRYEIVQAKRGVEDYYKITQGISGFPMKTLADTELCLPYFLTTSKFKIRRGFQQCQFVSDPDTNLPTAEVARLDNYVDVSYEGSNYSRTCDYKQYKNAVIFASPEYAYQPDDMKNILHDYNTAISYKITSVWQRFAQLTSTATNDFNFQLSYDGHIVHDDINWLSYKENSSAPSDLQKLRVSGTDLRIQLGTTSQSSGTEDIAEGEYFLSSQVMSMFNYSEDSNNASFEMLGARGESSYGKYAFFTNMYGEHFYDRHLNSDEKEVKNIVYVDSNAGEDFEKDEWPIFKQKYSTLLEGKKFFNWTNPVLLSYDVYGKITSGGDDTLNSFKQTTMGSYQDSYINMKYKHWAFHPDDYAYHRGCVGSYGLSFPTSPGGPSMILEFDSELFRDNLYNYDLSTGTATMPQIDVATIYKSATPYRGYNTSAIDNTQYISQGTCSNGIQSVKASMGDNFITMFVYCLYHNFDNVQTNSIPSAAIQYIVPIESTIDLSKQCSQYIQSTSTNSELTIGNGGKGVWVQVKPSTVAGRLIQTTDMYMYNTAYSVLPDIITYAGQDTVNTADSLYDSRIHYSQKKQNNELIDNWTSFKAIDYLDVDSRYGKITGLKLFKDKLIFLQENGAGVLSVNDRIILKDQESANIIVGNGGVLDRYDYFTTIYGMKPDQHVVEATNDALYWWDGHRREILGYTDGYNIALLQRIKNVQNYINNGTESDTPSIICDANNKEVLFNVVNNESLVYNEQIQQFTSVYTFNPIYYCNIYGDIYLTEPWFNWSRLCKYNVDNTDGEGPKLGLNLIKPKLKYIVNKDPIYNKVFDVQTFGGRFYGGDDEDLVNLNFDYKTPLKQHSRAEHGEGITNREYDYRLAIPRNNDDLYGGRMRGKTMECEITSDSNNKDFSIQYVTTKYRMSWT